MVWEEYKKEWLRENTCNFCQGSRMHTCTSYKCQPAYEEAEEHFEQKVVRDEVASGKRAYVISLFPYLEKKLADSLNITGAWLLSGNKGEEIIIQFHGNIPNMQQAAHVRHTIERLKNLAENMGRQEGAILHGLIDGIPSRAWKKSDEGIIKNGIPPRIKKDAAEERCSGKEEKE